LRQVRGLQLQNFAHRAEACRTAVRLREWLRSKGRMPNYAPACARALRAWAGNGTVASVCAAGTTAAIGCAREICAAFAFFLCLLTDHLRRYPRPRRWQRCFAQHGHRMTGHFFGAGIARKKKRLATSGMERPTLRRPGLRPSSPGGGSPPRRAQSATTQRTPRPPSSGGRRPHDPSPYAGSYGGGHGDGGGSPTRASSAAGARRAGAPAAAGGDGAGSPRRARPASAMASLGRSGKGGPAVGDDGEEAGAAMLTLARALAAIELANGAPRPESARLRYAPPPAVRKRRLAPARAVLLLGGSFLFAP
jgi:hypothetical protein